MNGISRFFLILLRIAIGWHFFFEGIDKVESMRRGPTETSRPFSSAGYLNESSGPMMPIIKEQIGDPVQAVIERCTPLATISDSKPPLPGSQYLSAVLVKEWDDYFKRYADYYGFEKVPGQMDKARAEFEKAKDKAGLWLIQGGKDVDKSFSRAEFKVPMSNKERLEDFKKKLAHIHELQEREIPLFNKDVEKTRLQLAKAEVAQLRNEMMADLKQPIDEALRGLLTPEQKEMKAMPADYGKTWATYSRLEWIDLIVSWGLVVVGACLMLGLFTRMSAFAGASFLLMLYAAMPPLPWVPEVTRTEGKYLFVNKNLVEMLALWVIATSRTGFWIGLDGLISYFNPFRRRNVVDTRY
jgi:uncharacterized membrane protein YphA (DoxX/SURF4 family)